MIAEAATLTGDVRMRLLQAADAEALSAAYRLNRDHLAPWEPARADEFFTAAGQRAVIESKLALHAAGQEVPWILLAGSRVVGAITLTGIVRGPFLSAHVGYWVDKDFNGLGIGSSAFAFVLAAARDELGLHRVQAATLEHNTPSRKILSRAGFDEIGLAPSYLKIAGSWQDHVLFQRILE
ncbi:GNAT family N-acetyltransferase [Arthrobacter sp. CC3]|jgi:ribosomal-protein-alanine N-acetyltransferase|uniref:GNAT family N-acetyltransferase n=1 Tax=Arthrobacter sp. CC3 TaxID=3029185 RepID=UPI003264DA3C